MKGYQSIELDLAWVPPISAMAYMEWMLAPTDFEARDETWAGAARIYFDLRRRGLTVGSPIDCCIAQIALEYDVLLLHRDRDFEAIAGVRTFREERLSRESP